MIASLCQQQVRHETVGHRSTWHTILLALTCGALLSATHTIALPTTKATDPAVLLSDRLFYRFLELYQADPGALARFAGGLRNLSLEQLDEAIDGMNTTQFTYLAPVVIPGHALPDLQGIALDEMSLMAARGGRMIPIPFQFDEHEHEGLIWMDNHSRQPAGDPGRLDDTDELVFMFRDGGTERYTPLHHGMLEGDIIHEIVLTPTRKNTRYAYLVRHNPQRSDTHYVTTDLQQGRIDSTVMEMDFDPGNIIEINHVASKVGPHQGENVFDNFYLEMNTGILSSRLRINLDSRKNIRAIPVAVKNGPVRSVIRLRARIWYLGLPTLLSHEFDMIVYEQGIVFPTQFAIESLGAFRLLLSFLRDPRITLTVDFNNLIGSKVTYQSLYKAPDFPMGVVDGTMSPFEEKLNQVRMPGEWLLLDSGRGWQMFFHNRIPLTENGLFDHFLQGAAVKMVYNDDRDHTNRQQQHKGNLPRLGFESSGMPEPVRALLAASPRIPRGVRTLGDAIYHLADSEKHQRMQHYDHAAGTVLSQLKEDGIITTPDEFAEAFIQDMGRMHYTGIPREHLGDLLRDAIRDTVEDVGEVRHGQILARMIALADERGIDLRNLRHATMNNALWFPPSMGKEGPIGFYEEVSNPPSVDIKPFTLSRSNSPSTTLPGAGVINNPLP